MNIVRELEFDVAVCGAGSAGFAAAVSAARAGAKTAVFEKYGMPGGCMTVMGNPDVAQFYAHKKQIIDGVGWEFIKRCEARGFCTIPDMFVDAPHWKYGVRVNPVGAAAVMDEMFSEAGVEVFYHQPAVSVETEGERVCAIIVSTKSGLMRVRAKAVIDCTGDGDVCVYAGASYELGDNMDNHLQPGTIGYYVSRREADAEELARLDGIAAEKREAEGVMPSGQIRPDCTGVYNARGINLNHISDFNGADSDSKTLAEIQGRRYLCDVMDHLKEIGAWQYAEITGCAPEVAMRETRRIVCDTRITAEDYVAAKHYPDSVCHSFYPIDLHRSGDDGGIYQIFLTDGQVPRIPMSAMTVKGFKNLLVAGRCACGDRLANSAYRVKASCMAMGQAAAVCAAVTVNDGLENVRDADIEKIRDILRQQNAIVPESN